MVRFSTPRQRPLRPRCFLAWIRLDDQIAHHPKFAKVGVSGWFWVCSIGFCQKFLTDGFIPSSSIRTIASGIDQPERHVQKLVNAGLFEKVAGGYKVHDYLQFNDSAKVVRAKREADRVRKESERNPSGQAVLSGRNPESVLARAPASHPIPSLPEDRGYLKEQAIEQKARAVASPRFPKNGNGHDQLKNLKVITQLVHEAMKAGTEHADLPEAVKTLCAKNHIHYDSEVVHKAVDSAEAQRQKRL